MLDINLWTILYLIYLSSNLAVYANQSNHDIIYS